MSVQIEHLSNETLEESSRLVRSSLPSRLTPYMTQMQPEITNLWKISLRYPDVQNDVTRLVAIVDDQVVGYVEWHRLSVDEAFLSNICVDANFRGRGVARRLIGDYIHEHREIANIGLDVFTDNMKARKLYTWLGFSGGLVQHWFVRSIPNKVPGVRITNFPEAIAKLDAFGVTYLDVEWRGKTSRMGIIGGKTVNCDDIDSFCDAEMLSALRGSIPSLGNALLRTSKDLPVGCAVFATKINESVRLQAHAEQVRSALGDR